VGTRMMHDDKGHFYLLVSKWKFSFYRMVISIFFTKTHRIKPFMPPWQA
jgi:hypothetical protein